MDPRQTTIVERLGAKRPEPDRVGLNLLSACAARHPAGGRCPDSMPAWCRHPQLSRMHNCAACAPSPACWRAVAAGDCTQVSPPEHSLTVGDGRYMVRCPRYRRSACVRAHQVGRRLPPTAPARPTSCPHTRSRVRQRSLTRTQAPASVAMVVAAKPRYTQTYAAKRAEASRRRTDNGKQFLSMVNGGRTSQRYAERAVERAPTGECDGVTR